MIYLIIFYLSSFIGSFLYCLNNNGLFRRSHCDKCKHTLHIFDLIPIFSFLLLKGRCRYCNERIDIKHLLWEIIMGIFNCLIYYRYGFSRYSLYLFIITTLMVSLSIEDFNTMTISDYYHICFILLRFMYVEDINIFLLSLFNGLLISVSLLLMVLINNLISKKESMGYGDIKLFFSLGIFFNYIDNLTILLFSAILALICCLLFKMKDKFAFGPFICLIYYVFLLLK